ncbi:MAG: hypothetical protein LBR48_05800, partial [Dysgonamonadaceae bacterium]|nr:hypothetical protein [Dysgonamonadaceae bacterium]
LDFDNIFVLRRNNRLSMDCYFDSKTKNYVGAKFVFTEGLVSYFTIAKINALENKLMQAGINAGTSYLLDSSKKYFCIRVTCSIGKTREELMRN